MDILDLIASDNYIPYNRTLAKELGIEPAILFGALCGYQRHYKTQEFFREQANIIEDTCLTEYAIRQATKILQQKELIIVEKKGLPAKNYYQINTKKLIECLSTSGYENDTTGDYENDTTSDSENITTNNKNENKNNNNNKIKEQKHHYGEYKNVLLTDTEVAKLTNEFTQTKTEQAITYLDEYIEMKGYKAKSHYLAIRKWVFDAIKERQPIGFKQREYNDSNNLFDDIDNVKI